MLRGRRTPEMSRMHSKSLNRLCDRCVFLSGCRGNPSAAQIRAAPGYPASPKIFSQVGPQRSKVSCREQTWETNKKKLTGALCSGQGRNFGSAISIGTPDVTLRLSRWPSMMGWGRDAFRVCDKVRKKGDICLTVVL